MSAKISKFAQGFSRSKAVPPFKWHSTKLEVGKIPVVAGRLVTTNRN